MSKKKLNTDIDTDNNINDNINIEEKKEKQLSTEKKSSKKNLPEKVEKTYSYDSLPKFFKKTYTEKSLQRKIYRKIYIPEDRKFIEDLFGVDDDGINEKVSIPKDVALTKQELARVKSLAKQIKSQKGRIKLLPLIASVALLALVVVGVYLTKNLIAKKAIVSAMQGIFGAKCDVQKVDVKLFDSNIFVKGLAVANKNEPMKNLFETGVINIDFDLNELLKKKFAADNLECSDIKTNTDRTVSGALPEKKKSADDDSNSLVNQLKQKANDALEEAKVGIENLFEEYNPETILEKVYSELKTPVVAEEVKTQAIELVDKWKSVPEKYETDVNSFVASAQNLSNIDVAQLKSNPTKLASTIKEVQNTIQLGESLSTNIKTTTSDIKTDTNKIKSLGTNLTNAVNEDSKLAKSKVDKIASFKIPTGKQMFGNAIDSLGYKYLGKYYPYVEKVCGIAKEQKSKIDEHKASQPKKEKKEIVRAKGRTVLYKKDIVPKFLLRHALVSGEGFAFEAKDVSSDMNLYGKPSEATGNITINNLTHDAKVVADFRRDSKAMPIAAEYSCAGLPIDYDFSTMVSATGIPKVQGVAKASFKAAANEYAEFTLSGGIDLKDAVFTAASFEPEYASRLYSQALSMLTEINADVTIGYSKAQNLIFDIDTNADKQLMNILAKLVNQELVQIKNQVIVKIEETLKEKTGDANFAIGSFNDISSKIGDMQNQVEGYKKQLEEKLNALTSQATDAAKSKAQEATNKAQEAVKSGTQNLLKGLKF